MEAEENEGRRLKWHRFESDESPERDSLMGFRLQTRMNAVPQRLVGDGLGNI